jgi:hypothetical protein
MDQFLQWYNRLPAKNLMVAVVAAFAMVAAFQTFASSGEYQASSSGAQPESATAWSSPGRYFLECQPVAKGEKCLNPDDDPTVVYAKNAYTTTYRTIELPAGAYTLNLKYRNVGDVPANYSFSVKVKVNGQPISAGTDGTVSLPTTGSQPWSSEFPVTLPAGQTKISFEWTNPLSGEKGQDPNFGIEQLNLVSKQASEAVAKRDDQRRQDLNLYREALAKYVADTGKYPTQTSALGMTEANEPFKTLQGKYLETFLTDPSEGHAYYYVSNGSRYGLCADLQSDPGVRYEVGPSGSRQVNGRAKECALLN